jgi:hypothetical protein
MPRAKPQRQTAQAYGGTTADYGPAIRREDIAVPARLRTNDDGKIEVVEASVAIGSWPDPDSPDRRQDISGAIAWLPLRLYRSGDLTAAQAAAATRYRDNLDMAAGASDRQPGFTHHTAPWARTGVTDAQLQAREFIHRADAALGRDGVRAVRAFVTLDTLQEMALAIGPNRKRVMVTIRRALDDLSDHLSGAKMAA